MNRNKAIVWIFSAVAAIAAMSATCFASGPVVAPEADPSLLIAVGVAAVTGLAGLSKIRRK